MSSTQPLRVASLVDLPRTNISGGHARGWERLAYEAAKSSLPLELTVFFSGKDLNERLSEKACIRHLPPVFSTSKLKFLPYVPDHTDLAPYHPQLARELASFDIIHTTDGFFAFARTAERVSRKLGIPLVSSIHTDTPSYARIFTRRTIEKIFSKGKISHFLTDILRLPEKQEAKMNKRLCTHLKACSHALATRKEDLALVHQILGPEKTHTLHTAVDYEMFGPHRKDRAAFEANYNIPKDRIICVFVGRLDEGKNIYTLIEAMEKLIAEKQPVHLITAGVGPAAEALKERLQGHVTVAGFIEPNELGKIYASADLLAMPSEVETRSLVATEAMASGLPVLVSQKSTVAAIYNNTTAIRIVAGGSDKWAEALRDLINDAPLREQMAQEALTYTKNNIPSWGSFLEQSFMPVWQKAFKEKPLMERTRNDCFWQKYPDPSPTP
ncbi:MAG TPA: hypothetical protein DD400_02190 [Rhodospirillaceae bacterium]|nr:hypothetical protein [Rhodospirillaceae bacterium]